MKMESFAKIRKIFWTETFWLPGNHSWDELKNKEDGLYYPQVEDLYVPLYLSVFISLARIIFDRFLAENIGCRLGLKGTVKKAPTNAIYEEAFKLKKSPSGDVLESLAKQTNVSRRQVERWFRVRRNQERTPVLKKFKESAWRGIYYFFIFWFGVYMHLDKPWFYKTIDCWQGWPKHTVDDDVYWYYMIQLGFYLSLMFSLFTDIRRKDFTEMIVHHISTILLLSLSWINNFVRMGTLILLVHDAVDSWMEGAKVSKYLNYNKLCEAFFFTFMVVWVITRMIIFPFRIIYSTMFEALPLMGGLDMPYFSMYTVYNGLLCVLQVLHIIWFYYIYLIAKDAFQGEMNDSRSSMESASESEEDVKHKKKKKSTNHVKDDIGKQAGSNGLVHRSSNKVS